MKKKIEVLKYDGEFCNYKVGDIGVILSDSKFGDITVYFPKIDDWFYLSKSQVVAIGRETIKEMFVRTYKNIKKHLLSN